MYINNDVLISVASEDVKDGTVIIPPCVTSIGQYAFYNCIRLKSITIPANVVSIGGWAFDNCTWLTSVTIENGVTSIGSCAFYNCNNLTSITIPDSITHIGCRVFDCCSNLHKLLYVKATNADMTCRDYKYHLGQVHQCTGHIELCHSGFHYCTNAYDVLNYYAGKIGKDVRFFEVEVDHVSPQQRGDSKRVCSQIKLIREITSYAELLN